MERKILKYLKGRDDAASVIIAIALNANLVKVEAALLSLYGKGLIKQVSDGRWALI